MQLIDNVALTFLAAYLCAFFIFVLLYRRIEINFFWLSGAIFLVYILPKFVAYFVSGDDVFLPGSARLDRASANAAIICILAFMSAILASYAAAHVLEPARTPPPPVFAHDPGRDPDILRAVAIWVFVPGFLVILPAYWIAAEVTFDNLFAKRELVIDGQRTVAWALQKIAQVVKAGFYLVLLATLVTRDSRYIRALLLLAALSAIVYTISSQRSGILILALEMALAFQLAGVLRARYLLILMGGFALLNIAILSARAAETAQSLYWTDLIYRRYFFDLEKISALIEYFVSDPLYRFDTLGILASWADGDVAVTYSSHFFLAEQVFGIIGGVPPSILGEMIMYIGPISIIPLTLLLTLLLVRFERVAVRSPRPLTKLVLVVILSKLYFLTLNSDIMSSINRIVLDLAILWAGLFVYALFAGVLRVRQRV